MPMATRKSNADTHPGLPDKPHVRRTSKQVQDDRAQAMAAAVAEKQNQEANRRAVLASLAQIEQSIQREEEQMRLHAHRPDLNVSNQSESGNTINT